MTDNTAFETITLEVSDGLARLTLNRPEARNGITNRMVRELGEALRAAAGDASVRVLVLTGAGSTFCPGADLNHFTGGGPDERLTAAHLQSTALLHEMPAVTIAAINGACAGAGLAWALACDLRFMVSGARLNTAFLDVAVAGDMGLPWTLSRLVGAGRARELSFYPRRVEADEALRLGLVDRVSSPDTFASDTEEALAQLLRKSPTALVALKENYVAAERMGFGDFVRFEGERHLRIAGGEHAAEAFRAFVEKREPRFS